MENVERDRDSDERFTYIVAIRVLIVIEMRLQPKSAQKLGDKTKIFSASCKSKTVTVDISPTFKNFLKDIRAWYLYALSHARICNYSA